MEKITTFSLLMSPSTKDLGSDPPMLADEVSADSVLLEPNNPMYRTVKVTASNNSPVFQGYCRRALDVAMVKVCRSS